MILRLFAVFLLALQGGPIDGEQLRGAETAFAIRAAVCSDGECDAKRGELLSIIAAEETRGRDGVRGDRGASCGRYQLGSAARVGVSCDSLDADPYLDARTAYAALLTFERQCGSMHAGLAAYASGSCTRALWYADRRCRLAGGCP